MNSRYSHSHASYVHHEVAVTVNPYNIAFDACEVTGDDAEFCVGTGIVFEWVEKKADVVGGGVEDAHEGLHLRVGDDGWEVGAAVVYEVVGGKLCVKILLECFGRALEEDETVDCGFLDFLDASGVLAAAVDDGFVNEMADAVTFGFFGELFNFAVVDEDVTPCRRDGLLLRITDVVNGGCPQFYFWTNRTFWLRNIDTLVNTDSCVQSVFQCVTSCQVRVRWVHRERIVLSSVIIL